MKLLSAALMGLDSAPDKLTEKIKSPWAGLVVLGVVFLAGMGAATFAGEVRSFEPRISALETVVGIGGADTLDERVERLEGWRSRHVNDVTRPNVRRIGSVEEDVGQLKTMAERNQRLLSCLYYDIRPCPGAPPPPPRAQ